MLVEELAQVQLQLDECKQLCVASKANTETASEDLEYYAQALAVSEEQFAAHGGELYQRRERIVAQVATLKAELASVTDQAHTFVAGTAPLLLVRQLLDIVSSIGHATQETEEQQLLLTSHKERDDRIVEPVSYTHLRAHET